MSTRSFRKVDTPAHIFNCVMEGLDLLNANGVKLIRDTAALFLGVGSYVGAFGEAVDVLLDREKRLGVHLKMDHVHSVLYK
jgi:hypothetical protein